MASENCACELALNAKLFSMTEQTTAQVFRKSLLENALVLILLGIVVGGVAGLGIGLIQRKASTPAVVGK